MSNGQVDTPAPGSRDIGKNWTLIILAAIGVIGPIATMWFSNHKIEKKHEETTAIIGKVHEENVKATTENRAAIEAGHEENKKLITETREDVKEIKKMKGP